MSSHGVVLEITNLSPHTFRLDGEALSSGEWRSDPAAPLLARGGRLRVEVGSPSALAGTKGVLWWIDDEDHAVYLSMGFSNPRFQTGMSSPSFTCFAGLPPANLKEELAKAEHLVLGAEAAPLGAGCSWRARELGAKLVIEVVVESDLLQYIPPEKGGVATGLFADFAPEVGGTPSPSPAGHQYRPLLGGHDHRTSEGANNAVGGQSGGGGAAASSSSTSATRQFRDKTRPRDFQHGLTSGLSTVAGGLTASVVLPATMAYSGAKERGAWGFAKGLGLGLLGGCTCAAAGAVAGVAQVGRGIKHTPAAMASRREEKVWDTELGRWVDVDLCALEVEFANSSDEGSPRDDRFAGSWNDGGRGGSSSSDAAAAVVDTTYYDVLGVAPSASSSEIKRAYYREARRCHPDKNPGDEKATSRFQYLAKAYSILSDSSLRELYDQHGLPGLEEQEGGFAAPQLDPAVFFALLFGSDRFLDYTGELHLAMLTDHLSETCSRLDAASSAAPEQPQPKDLARRQERREVKCALKLRARLDRLVSQRDYAGFVEDVRAEAVELAGARFGPELLVELGQMYKIRAEIYLANESSGRLSLSKRAAAAKRSGHSARTCMKLTKGVVGGLTSAKKISDAVKREEREAEGGARPAGSLSGGVEEAVDRALPKFLNAAWASVVRDLDLTVKNVGRKLLQDKSVPWQLRIRRAEALHVLGEIFEDVGSHSGAVPATAGAAGGRRCGSAEGLSSEAARETVLEAALGCASRASGRRRGGG